MSDRKIELFIFDVYIAILKIEQTSSKFDNVQDLLHSYTDWDSVIREFEIIGEASKYLLKDKLINNTYQVIIDFRNIIVHEYFGIEPVEVWDIIFSDLGKFKEIILELICNIKEDLRKELVDSFLKDNEYLEFIIDKLILLKK